FWTILAHYPHLLKRAIALLRPKLLSPTASAVPQPPRRVSLGERLRRALLARAHGEYPSAISELYFFSKRRWIRVFRESGLSDVTARSNRLFLTGYRLIPSLPVAPRRAMSRVLGSSCNVFTLRKTSGTGLSA